MELHFCKEFVTLAQTQNYMEAAERLFMAQSTLSRHIQSLEKKLGRKLFVRSTRKVELTDFGKRYYKYAKKVTEIEDEFTNSINLPAVGSENELSLNLCYLSSYFGIPTILSTLRREHPEIQLSVSLADAASSQHNCVGGFLDMFICREYSEEPDRRFERIPLFRDQVLLVMSKDNPLAQEKTITPKDTQHECLITTGLSYGPYRHFETACHNAGFDPAPQYINPNLSWVTDMVSLNLGVTVLAESFYRCFPGYFYLTARPFQKALQMDISLLYRKGREVSPSMQIVLDTFTQEAKKIPLHRETMSSKELLE